MMGDGVVIAKFEKQIEAISSFLRFLRSLRCFSAPNGMRAPLFRC
jgi:hypothetical protein